MIYSSFIEILSFGAGLNFAFGAFSQYTNQLVSAEREEIRKTFSFYESIDKSNTPTSELRRKLSQFNDIREQFDKIADSYEARSIMFAVLCAVCGSILVFLMVFASVRFESEVPKALPLLIAMLNMPWLLFLLKNLMDYIRLKVRVQSPRINWEDGLDSLTT